MKDLLKTMDEAIEKVEEYFGFEQEWRVYPIDDRTDDVWSTDGHWVRSNYEDEDYAEDVVINGKIYVKEDYTAILVDTQCDGNKFLAVFDNAKKEEWQEEDEE